MNSFLTDLAIVRLAAWGPEIALLLASHALADFVFQTREMVRSKTDSYGWFGLHILQVAVITGVLLAPLGHRTTALVVLWIAASHAAIDFAKTRIRPTLPAGRMLVVFVVDQTLHLAATLVGLRILTASPRTPLVTLAPAQLEMLSIGAVLLAAYAFVGSGGSAIVANVLAKYSLTGAATGAGDRAPQGPIRSAEMGHMIGLLERLAILTLVLLDQWGALGLILAAKSIARFKDLDDRSFSEYYLIGTLTSLLTAIATGLAVRLLI